jgi:hypothetical protein
MENLLISPIGTLSTMLNPLTFAVAVAVAIVATRSDPPWRLTALALGAALMTASAALLVAMANALDGISFRFRWADHIAASVLQIIVAYWIVRWWRARRRAS